MDICFKNQKMADNYKNKKWLIRKFGVNDAKKISQRISQLSATSNLKEALDARVGRIHPLSNDLRGFYALDLEYPHRLIIRPVIEEDDVKKDDLKYLIKILVIEIIKVEEDYHG